jgi:hypothetical protein
MADNLDGQFRTQNRATEDGTTTTGPSPDSQGEQRFLGQSLYAWFVSARKGRIEVSTDDIEIAKEFDQRRRAWKRSHT